MQDESHPNLWMGFDADYLRRKADPGEIVFGILDQPLYGCFDGVKLLRP
jgi:hypothetical protein